MCYRSEKTKRRRRDRDLEVVDSHSRRLKKHKHHHRRWREEGVSSQTASSQRLSPTASDLIISARKSHSRSHHDRQLPSDRSKHRHRKRRKKDDEIPSCSPSELEEEEQGSSSTRATKSAAAEKIVEVYSHTPSSDNDEENPYPAVVSSAVLDGSVPNAAASGDSQTTGKVETPDPLASSTDVELTVDKADEEGPRDDKQVDQDQFESDAGEVAVEDDDVLEDECIVMLHHQEDSQDLNETQGTEEDPDGHEPVLASTVHKVDSSSTCYNSIASTMASTTSSSSYHHKRSRHKERKHKSHEHRHHYHHQNKEHGQHKEHSQHKEHGRHKEHSRHKHERRKKEHQLVLSDRDRSIHERKHSSIKKKKRKHSSHRE